ncbi:hypothetical protein NL676_039267 [Syzygium grande]|nr:hypothetical protein NL676_039267 [Syzygium grande]
MLSMGWSDPKLINSNWHVLKIKYTLPSSPSFLAARGAQPRRSSPSPRVQPRLPPPCHLAPPPSSLVALLPPSLLARQPPTPEPPWAVVLLTYDLCRLCCSAVSPTAVTSPPPVRPIPSFLPSSSREQPRVLQPRSPEQPPVQQSSELPLTGLLARPSAVSHHQPPPPSPAAVFAGSTARLGTETVDRRCCPGRSLSAPLRFSLPCSFLTAPSRVAVLGCLPPSPSDHPDTVEAAIVAHRPCFSHCPSPLPGSRHPSVAAVSRHASAGVVAVLRLLPLLFRPPSYCPCPVFLVWFEISDFVRVVSTFRGPYASDHVESKEDNCMVRLVLLPGYGED